MRWEVQSLHWAILYVHSGYITDVYSLDWCVDQGRFSRITQQDILGILGPFILLRSKNLFIYLFILSRSKDNVH